MHLLGAILGPLAIPQSAHVQEHLKERQSAAGDSIRDLAVDSESEINCLGSELQRCRLCLAAFSAQFVTATTT